MKLKFKNRKNSKQRHKQRCLLGENAIVKNIDTIVRLNLDKALNANHNLKQTNPNQSFESVDFEMTKKLGVLAYRKNIY